MNMQEHILAALREQFDRWEALLADISDEQITTSHVASGWSIKDEIAYLQAWQQRSVARMEGAVEERAPEFPIWLAEVDPESYDNTEQINDWIYQTYRDQPWSEVHRAWGAGFGRLLQVGAQIAEKDLLDSERYAWMNGQALAFVLLATYDHHQEHLEELIARLDQPASS